MRVCIIVIPNRLTPIPKKKDSSLGTDAIQEEKKPIPSITGLFFKGLIAFNIILIEGSLPSTRRVCFYQYAFIYRVVTLTNTGHP